METVFLSKVNFEELKTDLEEIKTHIKNIAYPSEHFVDNDTFAELMGVSPRTAQTWRDEGLIGFSKPKRKVYYRMSDINEFLEKFYQKASGAANKLG